MLSNGNKGNNIATRTLSMTFIDEESRVKVTYCECDNGYKYCLYHDMDTKELLRFADNNEIDRWF